MMEDTNLLKKAHFFEDPDLNERMIVPDNVPHKRIPTLKQGISAFLFRRTLDISSGRVNAHFYHVEKKGYVGVDRGEYDRILKHRNIQPVYGNGPNEGRVIS